MILYHGTSRSRAELICQEGFKRPDFDSGIQEIANRYEIDTDVLRSQLSELGRFSSFRSDDTKVYFSSHIMHAASYATRAPEFYWEGLWGVYTIWNPELGLNWNQSDEGHAWVLSQMQSDPPVILHVDVPEEILGQDVERIKSYRAIMPPESGNGGTEVGLTPSPVLKAVDQTVGDYWIDASLLRFLTGLTPKELEVEILQGLWGESFQYQRSEFRKWNEVKTRLPYQRLSKLGLL